MKTNIIWERYIYFIYFLEEKKKTEFEVPSAFTLNIYRTLFKKYRISSFYKNWNLF